MKKLLLSLLSVCALAGAANAADQKKFQLVTDLTEITNPDNKFLIVSQKSYSGSLYAVTKTGTAGSAIIRQTQAPTDFTISNASDYAYVSIEADGDKQVAHVYKVDEAGSYTSVGYYQGNNKTDLKVQTAIANASEIYISIDTDYTVKFGSKSLNTRAYSFSGGTVFKNYATSNITTTDATYSYPLFYKEIVDIETPQINFEVNGAKATVSISCKTEGATIYYGTSVDDITTEYSAPFEVTENGTIYAIAKKGEDESNAASVHISGIPYTSFKDVVTKAEDQEEVTIIGNFSVIYQAFSNVILTDGTSNILVYGVTDVPKVGTKISKVEGTASPYKGLFEITNPTLTEGGEGAEYSAKQVNTLVGITENNVFDQIIIDGCTTSGTENNQTVSFGTETLPLYNRYKLDITNGTSYKMYAFVWINNNVLSLVPYQLEAGTVKETVKAPVITPTKRELTEEDKVTITCSTVGATIYYTIDGENPTQESEKYTEPFTVVGDVTVKARAYYEGEDKEMLPSEIVSKEYHAFDPYCNVIDNSHEEGGGSYSAHRCIVDKVEYTMYGMHNSTKGIQMNQKKDTNNNTRFCFIAQTGDNERLAIDKITFDFNENSKNIEFTIRASNVPYEIDVENYDADKVKEYLTSTGDVIGTISTNGSVEFNKDYDYFVLYPDPSSSNAVYINSITVNYRKPADADESVIPSFENFEIISSEEGLLTSELPFHEDWATTKYQLNDGEVMDFNNSEDNDGIFIEGALDPATLHTLKIWYEHYYHGTSSSVNEFYHLTEPTFTVDTENESMSFGQLGEGVKVYFTINGSDPEIPASAPANAPRRAKASEGVYYLDSADDAAATHVIDASNTTIKVSSTVAQAVQVNAKAVQVNAKAVHTETGAVSAAVQKSGVTTGIVSIEANGNADKTYDLMGRKVVKPAHGLYIVNGQKVRL